MTEPHGTPPGARTIPAIEGWQREPSTTPRSTGWPPSARRSSGSWCKKKNAFVVPATIFFLAWYFGFVILCGYAPDFMGEEFLVDGLTVGYVLALSQFVMVWGLAAWYLRKSDRVFDPLAERAAERALEAGRGGSRFERSLRARAAAATDEEVTRR